MEFVYSICAKASSSHSAMPFLILWVCHWLPFIICNFSCIGSAVTNYNSLKILLQ